jgi:hypothetical protein
MGGFIMMKIWKIERKIFHKLQEQGHNTAARMLLNMILRGVAKTLVRLSRQVWRRGLNIKTMMAFETTHPFLKFVLPALPIFMKKDEAFNTTVFNVYMESFRRLVHITAIEEYILRQGLTCILKGEHPNKIEIILNGMIVEEYESRKYRQKKIIPGN